MQNSPVKIEKTVSFANRLNETKTASLSGIWWAELPAQSCCSPSYFQTNLDMDPDMWNAFWDVEPGMSIN